MENWRDGKSVPAVSPRQTRDGLRWVNYELHPCCQTGLKKPNVRGIPVYLIKLCWSDPIFYPRERTATTIGMMVIISIA